LTVQVRNGSKKELELLLTATLAYGPDGKLAAEVTLESELGGMEVLQPGDEVSHDWGFIVPAKFQNDVVLEITVDLEHERSVFSGSIKAK
jgi:hypothetical protein